MLNTCHFLEKQGFRVTYLPVTPDGIVHADELAEGHQEGDDSGHHHGGQQRDRHYPAFRARLGPSPTRRGRLPHRRGPGRGQGPHRRRQGRRRPAGPVGAQVPRPQGHGGAIRRKGRALRPVVYGGGHERGYRSSTENIPGIVGMGKACELAMEGMDENVAQMTRIRNRIIEGVLPDPEQRPQRPSHPRLLATTPTSASTSSRASRISCCWT